MKFETHVYKQTIPEGEYSFLDYFGDEITVNPDEAFYKEIFEGSLVYIWEYKKKKFISTNRKIDAHNSKPGFSKETLLDFFLKNQHLYKSLDQINTTDDRIHEFLITDSILLSCSRAEVDNIVYYRGTYVTNEEDLTVEYTKEELAVQIQLTKEEGNNTKLFQFFDEKFNMTIDQVNSYLHFSNRYLSPTRENKGIFDGGERVHLFFNGQIYNIISPSYSWRNNIMDGSTNYLSVFCELLKPEHMDYPNNEKKHVYVHGVTLNFLKNYVENYEITNVPDTVRPNEEETSTNKFMIILSNVFFAVPLDKMKAVIEMYGEFSNDIIHVSNFLYEHSKELKALLAAKKLNEFPSLHGIKVDFVSYLEILFRKVFYDTKKEPASQIFNDKNVNVEEYPEYVKAYFNTLKKQYWEDIRDRNVSKAVIDKYIYVARFMLHICNSWGKPLYKLLNLTKSYEKTMASRKKISAAKAKLTEDNYVEKI